MIVLEYLSSVKYLLSDKMRTHLVCVAYQNTIELKQLGTVQASWTLEMADLGYYRPAQSTEVRFASFLSCGFTTGAPLCSHLFSTERANSVGKQPELCLLQLIVCPPAHTYIRIEKYPNTLIYYLLSKSCSITVCQVCPVP